MKKLVVVHKSLPEQVVEMKSPHRANDSSGKEKDDYYGRIDGATVHRQVYRDGSGEELYINWD